MPKFPAARVGDPVTHDSTTPSGVVGPGPCAAPYVVQIEGLPAAHAMDTAVCTGATAAGVAHPPSPPAPPFPIPVGSPVVLVHGKPACRWLPSGDLAICGALLGNAPLSASRSVLIGTGMAPVLHINIVIIAGTAYDSAAGRERIARYIARMQELLGYAIAIDSVQTVDDPDLQTMTAYGPWDGADNYNGGEAVEAINDHGSPDAPTLIYTDQVVEPASAGGDDLNGLGVSQTYAGTNDTLNNEGVVMSDGITDETTTHEVGHLLSGEQGADLHSTDPNNIMYESGVPGRSQWTDPWESSALNSPYVDTPSP